MVAEPSHIDSDTAGAFERLRDEVAKLNHGSRVPTAAGLKSSLQRNYPDFDERVLGYKRFIEFLEEAQAHGYVSVLRDSFGHPRIYPTGAATAIAKVAISEPDTVAMGSHRLRSDVWRAVIDWEENYTRAWDRRVGRAFMYPADDGSTPPWTKQPGRFVQITPISQETQIGWMKEFAEFQIDSARDELVVSLGVGAPRGQFKQLLAKYQLDAAWSRALQAHAARFVQGWASSNAVAIKNLFDHRSQGAQKDSTEAQRTTTTGLAVPNMLRQDTLREQLHGVIDRMSPEDLASLRIPARYLIVE